MIIKLTEMLSIIWRVKNTIKIGPYCQWTRVRDAIASRKTEKRFSGSSDDPKSFCIGRGPSSIKNGRKIKLIGSSDKANSFCVRRGGPEDLLVLKVVFLWQTNSNFQKYKSLEATQRCQCKNQRIMLLRFESSSINESLPVELPSIHPLLWYFLILPLAPFPPTLLLFWVGPWLH